VASSAESKQRNRALLEWLSYCDDRLRHRLIRVVRLTCSSEWRTTRPASYQSSICEVEATRSLAPLNRSRVTRKRRHRHRQLRHVVVSSSPAAAASSSPAGPVGAWPAGRFTSASMTQHARDADDAAAAADSRRHPVVLVSSQRAFYIEYHSASPRALHQTSTGVTSGQGGRAHPTSAKFGLGICRNSKYFWVWGELGP